MKKSLLTIALVLVSAFAFASPGDTNNTPTNTVADTLANKGCKMRLKHAGDMFSITTSIDTDKIHSFAYEIESFYNISFDLPNVVLDGKTSHQVKRGNKSYTLQLWKSDAITWVVFVGSK